jgi:hypothetical protein
MNAPSVDEMRDAATEFYRAVWARFGGADMPYTASVRFRLVFGIDQEVMHDEEEHGDRTPSGKKQRCEAKMLGAYPPRPCPYPAKWQCEKIRFDGETITRNLCGVHLNSFRGQLPTTVTPL